MPITITIRSIENGDKTVQVEGTDLVSVLIQKIAEQMPIPPDQQRLIYRGTILDASHTVASYGIEDGHTVHVVLRPTPRSPEPSRPSSEGSAESRQGPFVAVPSVGMINSGWQMLTPPQAAGGQAVPGADPAGSQIFVGAFDADAADPNAIASSLQSIMSQVGGEIQRIFSGTGIQQPQPQPQPQVDQTVLRESAPATPATPATPPVLPSLFPAGPHSSVMSRGDLWAQDMDRQQQLAIGSVSSLITMITAFPQVSPNPYFGLSQPTRGINPFFHQLVSLAFILRQFSAVCQELQRYSQSLYEVLLYGNRCTTPGNVAGMCQEFLPILHSVDRSIWGIAHVLSSLGVSGDMLSLDSRRAVYGIQSVFPSQSTIPTPAMPQSPLQPSVGVRTQVDLPAQQASRGPMSGVQPGRHVHVRINRRPVVPRVNPTQLPSSQQSVVPPAASSTTTPIVTQQTTTAPGFTTPSAPSVSSTGAPAARTTTGPTGPQLNPSTAQPAGFQVNPAMQQLFQTMVHGFTGENIQGDHDLQSMIQNMIPAATQMIAQLFTPPQPAATASVPSVPSVPPSSSPPSSSEPPAPAPDHEDEHEEEHEDDDMLDGALDDFDGSLPKH